MMIQPRLNKLLRALPSDLIEEIKESEVTDQLLPTLEQIVCDYRLILHESKDIINAIYEYENVKNRIRITDEIPNAQQEQLAKKERNFTSTLGTWPGEEEKKAAVNPIDVDLDLKQFRPNTKSLIPL